MLSNTPMLNFCYLKKFYILHLCDHSKMIVHILKKKQKKNCKNKDDNNRSHREDIINWSSSRHRDKYIVNQKIMKKLIN